MRRYRYRYETVDCFDSDVCNHYFKLRCVPSDNEFQHLTEHRLHISPCNKVHFGVDGYGNAIQYGEQVERHNFFAFVSRGVVTQQPYAIPDSSPQFIYRMPSALTVVSEEMSCFLNDLVAIHVASIAAHLCHAVHNRMTYRPGFTDSETTARDAFSFSTGVCQDYAHVMIALCRAAGLMARYVNGFLLGTGETHAWVEVFDNGIWKGFDPTNDCDITYGYIKVAHGRDANDCPVNRGVYSGCSQQQTGIKVTVEEL